MCTSKFKIEQEQLELIKEYLPASRLAAIEKGRAPPQLQADFVPVSDNEEDDTGDIQTKIAGWPSEQQCIVIGNSGQGEEEHRPELYEIDNETEHPLPENQSIRY